MDFAWKNWKGTNKFYCSGKVMMGPDNHRALITFCLVNIPGLIFLVFPTAYFITEQGNPTILLIDLFFQVLISYYLWKTATTDPGYLVKQVPPLARGPIGAPTLNTL
jgi:palmitoyltransferase ZDHHC9/14/18